MRICPECMKRYPNDLAICFICKYRTVDENEYDPEAPIVYPEEDKKQPEQTEPVKSNRTSVEKIKITEPESAPKKLVLIAKPTGRWAQCKGSIIMNVIAILTWIGGLITAIVLGSNATGWGGNFDFGTFLIAALVSAISGGVFYAIGELMTNVASIASSLSSIRIEEK